LKDEKKLVTRNRTIGIGSVILGLIAVVGYSFTQILITIGGVLVLIGIFLLIKNSPKRTDLDLNNLIKEREGLLSDRGRITEYRNTLANIHEKIRERSENIVLNENELKSLISDLPPQPQQYSIIIDQAGMTRESVQNLRANIQQDLITLGKLTTEKKGTEKIANTLKEEQKNKEKYETALQTRQSDIDRLDHQCIDIQKEYNISIEKSDSIKNERDKAQRRANELETNLVTYGKLASQKESLENELNEINTDIIGLETEIVELENEKGEYLLGERVKLEEENNLRIENDSLKKLSASLETEQKERQSDIDEAKSIMTNNFELQELYPELVKQVENERFEINAMTNAITLLDVTRDGIMAGVKTRIESHMVQFLPALTDQRYSMARIDEKNYRIEVYDREARRWRIKGVFSGATQDQFSLALRLAFALSTIPSTRGARPGFIFLDEPLSGFDVQRRKGFMLLLHNELPKYFDQIIVISHLEALQEEFPNHLLLEAGKIVSA
jgi:exonuclease SbcC